MSRSNSDILVMSGTPLIGEGNIVDNKTFMAELGGEGIPVAAFYPNGPFVKLGRWFHTRMSMSTCQTMKYALKSGVQRSSLKILPLKLELRRALKMARHNYPGAVCFITSQNMMAEETADFMEDITTIMCSSDVNGKFSDDSMPSEKQKKIIHLVWSAEAFDFYKNGLGIPNVYLTIPTDPKDAFDHIEKKQLPFKDALHGPDLCFIKLSGSGGDPVLINRVLQSLWSKSRVRSIVFPGTKKTQRRLLKTVGKDVQVDSSLDPAVFYNQMRAMISNQQMLLAYPSEQVKHITILAQNNIYPKVAWLPPRGQHEVMNLAWAVKKGLSGTVCVPGEYWSLLRGRLMDLGVQSSDIEFVGPENITAEHFKPTPALPNEAGAVPLVNVVRSVMHSWSGRLRVNN